MAGAAEPLDPHHRLAPLAPAPRGPGTAGRLDQIAAVEEQARVHVPRDAPGPAVEDVGVPDAGEGIAGDRRRGPRDPLVERRQGMQRDELRNPGVAELGGVGRGVADEGGQQLLVRRGPGDLLHLDPDVGVERLELRHQLAHHLPLAAEPPEADGGARGPPHPVRRQHDRDSSARAATAARASRFNGDSSQPAAREAGAFQAANDVRILPHRLPDRGRCGSSRSSRRSAPGRCRGSRCRTTPAPGSTRAVRHSLARPQRRIEGVEKSVLARRDGAVALLHRAMAAIDSSGVKTIDEAAAVGAIVPSSRMSSAGGAARGVAVEAPPRAVDRQRRVHRAVAGGESPDAVAVVAPTPRIGDGVGALRERRAARVLEVIDAVRAHDRVLDAAEIDPDVRVLVPEERRELDVVLAVERAPVVGLRVLAPGAGSTGWVGEPRARTIDDHRLVVAAPVVGDEARLRASSPC